MSLLEKSWFGLLAWIFVIAGFWGLYHSWQASEWLVKPQFKEVQLGYGLVGKDQLLFSRHQHYLMARSGERYFLLSSDVAATIEENVRPGDIINLKLTDSPGFFHDIVVHLSREQDAKIVLDQEEAMTLLYRQAKEAQMVEPMIYSAMSVIGVLLLIARRIQKSSGGGFKRRGQV